MKSQCLTIQSIDCMRKLSKARGYYYFFGEIDVMAECEVEWLSPEVIQELLEFELEPEPSTPGPATVTVLFSPFTTIRLKLYIPPELKFVAKQVI